MTDRDLTPAEARAEVEAFLGSEWTVIAPAPDGTEDAGEECYVSAWRGPVAVHYFAPTFRAAVAALKQAWRDAVRPWVVEAFSEGEAHGIGEMNHKNDVGASEERAAVRIARVLGEDDKP